MRAHPCRRSVEGVRNSTHGRQSMRTSIFIVALAAAALVATNATAAPKWKQPKQAKTLAQQLAAARDATAKYVDGLARAKADGYQILTKMIPDMGYHFINPSVKGFDLRKPPILVYEHQGQAW